MDVPLTAPELCSTCRRADQGLEYKLKWDTEVGYAAIKIKYWRLCYDSVFCLVNLQLSAVYFENGPSQLFWEGKLGKPKKEIGNLIGFPLVGLRCHIFSTRLPYPYKVFPWAQHSSPPWQDSLCHRWTNRNWTKKDSTCNSLECEVEKTGSEEKSENLDTIHAKNCLHKGMWNGSTIRQNSVYVDALSNPFTQ